MKVEINLIVLYCIVLYRQPSAMKSPLSKICFRLYTPSGFALMAMLFNLVFCGENKNIKILISNISNL